MITRDYLRVMSRYNRWQNSEVLIAAASLSEKDRMKDRGAFWKSIQGTLSHIYWADRIWLSRFDLTDPPNVPLNQSDRFVDDFNELGRLRIDLDDLLVSWCDDYKGGPITGNLEWYSGAIQKQAKAPLGVIFAHFFNHQTHHRGQIHALITAAGGGTADTDLFLMPKELWPPQ
ncbi:MAG: DinB family protein [Pseudomonadota bacterium]